MYMYVYIIPRVEVVNDTNTSRNGLTHLISPLTERTAADATRLRRVRRINTDNQIIVLQKKNHDVQQQ